MEYIIILSYLLFCVYYFDIKRHKGTDFHYALMLILFVLLSGLAYRVGTDAIRYEDKFYGDYKFSFDWDLFTNPSEIFTGQPLWHFINWSFYHVFGEWIVFKLCLALFFNGTVFWYIKRHCSYSFTAVLFYFIFIYFEYNFESLRETCAICIMLIALDKFGGESGTEKNFAKYYSWVWPALLFHYFGFITLLPPLLSYFKYDKWLVLLAIVAMLTVYFVPMNALFDIRLLSLLPEDSLDLMNYYIESDKYGTTTNNLNAYIALFVRNIVAPLILFKNVKADNNQSLAISYILVTVLATFILAFYRVGNYFIVPMAVVLSESWGNGFYNKHFNLLSCRLFSYRFVFVVCLGLMISIRFSALFGTDLWDHFYPYSAVYDKHQYLRREILLE